MSEPLRICRVCRLEAWTQKDLELFKKDTSSLFGRGLICKKCANAYTKKRRIPKPKPIYDYLRKCRECGLKALTEEDLNLFKKSKDNKFGRTPLCKNCHNKKTNQHNKENRLIGRYAGMITRCYNKNDSDYPNYGGRGIYIVDEWRYNRQSFIDWANNNGFKPELSLDRIDNDGPYTPWNCRWATRSQQQRNTRATTTNWEKGTRICSDCKVEKPLTSFHKTIERKTGYNHKCKDCTKVYHKKYYQKNKLKL